MTTLIRPRVNKGRNELAELRGIDVNELIAATTANALGVLPGLTLVGA